MSELRLSLDFERLPEFWQLTEALRNARRNTTPISAVNELELNETAFLFWMRLPNVLDSSGFGPGNRQTVYYPNFQPMEAAL